MDEKCKALVDASAPRREPKQKVRIIEVPHKPSSYLEHHIIPETRAPSDKRHRRCQVIRGGPLNQTEVELRISFRVSRNPEAPEI
ncbi:hypothetical protein D3C76_1293480 [compost metagenome]